VAQDRPWRVGAVFDKHRHPRHSRTRLGGFFQHANVADRDHVATLRYVTSPTQPDDVTIAALELPRAAARNSAIRSTCRASTRASMPASSASCSAVRGRGRVLGLRYTQNLGATATWRHRRLWGVAQRPIDNEVGVVDGSPDLAPDITLHAASLG
jgi:hypothetical protein